MTNIENYPYVEKMTHEELMKELRGIAKLAFPGVVAKQRAECIVVELRKRKK